MWQELPQMCKCPYKCFLLRKLENLANKSILKQNVAANQYLRNPEMIHAFPAVQMHLNNLKVTGFSRVPAHKGVLNTQLKPIGNNPTLLAYFIYTEIISKGDSLVFWQWWNPYFTDFIVAQMKKVLFILGNKMFPSPYHSLHAKSTI